MTADLLNVRLIRDWALVVLMSIMVVGHVNTQPEEEKVLEVAVCDAAPYGFAASEGFLKGSW